MPPVILYNLDTHAPEAVEPTDVNAKLASGSYTESGGGEKFQAAGGTMTRSASDAAAAETMGESKVSTEDVGVADREKTIRAEFDNARDKAFTFSEGLVDALSLGLIHEHGEQADTRRDVNGGEAFLGSITGNVVGLLGPTELKLIAEGGEAAGKLAIKGLLKDGAESVAGKVAERAVKEGAAGAALGAAHATGSQVADSIIDDKPFAIEAVAAEAGVAGLMGIGFGAAGGLFEAGSKLGSATEGASRKAVIAQGGLLDPASQESKAMVALVNQAHADLGGAVGTYDARLGVMKGLEASGVIPKEANLVDFRLDAQKEVQASKKALDKIGHDVVNGSDDKAFEKWAAASERYQKAVKGYDEVMSSPGPMDHALFPGESDFTPVAGEAQPLPPEAAVDREQFFQPKFSVEGDVRMATDPELQAKYKEIYGRDFEPYADRVAAEGGNVGNRMPSIDELQMRIQNDAVSTPRASAQGAGDKTGVLGGQADIGTGLLPKTPQADVNTGLLPPDKLAAPVVTSEEVGNAFADVKKQMPTYQPAQADVWQAAMHDKTQLGSDAPLNAALDKAKADEAKAMPKAKPVEAPMGEPYKPDAKDAAKGQLKALMDEWSAHSKQMGNKISPADLAEMRLHNLLNDLNIKTGGKLDTVSGTMDWRQMGSSLTERVSQIRNMRKLAQMASDEARGIKTPLRDMAGVTAGRDYVKEYMAGKLGGAVVGSIMGGPKGAAAGYLLGSALAGRFAGMAGKVAATSGRMAAAVSKVGAKVLSNSRGVALSAAIAANKSYQYGDEPAIKDPVKRIQQIKELASNPQGITTKVKQAVGDFGIIAPDISEGLAQNALTKLQYLSIKAPALAMDMLGDVIAPSSERIRQFLETENAVHNPLAVMDAIANKSVTPQQLDAFKVTCPMMYLKVCNELISNPDKIKGMTRGNRAYIGKILGTPLTSTNDPTYNARVQAMYLNDAMTAQQAQEQKPQAFKMNEQTPTPNQAESKAPGN